MKKVIALTLRVPEEQVISYTWIEPIYDGSLSGYYRVIVEGQSWPLQVEMNQVVGQLAKMMFG